MRLRISLALATALTVSTALAQAPATQPAADASLEQQFRDPPAEARPRVWWHWVDGNVTLEAIDQDLGWLKRIGVAGLQNFDAGLKTPQVVAQRIAYMSPEWKRVFRHAVERASALGLEYGIAASPGWSQTGGPWVAPEDAMKKLVWSETGLSGGKRFNGVLPAPPSIAGPFQQIARHVEHGFHPPEFYRDALVLAFPQEGRAPLPTPVSVAVNGAAIDPTPLLDGKLDSGIALPAAQGSAQIEFDYARPQTVRSWTAYVANLPAQSASGPLVPQLQASDDGQTWRKVANLRLTGVPTTASFAPVTASRFRVLLTRAPRAQNSSFAPAPGVDLKIMAGVSEGPSEPPRLAELQLGSAPRVNAFEQKAGFALANDYYALDGGVGDNAAGIAPEAVIDLTGRLTADGRLDWKPPRLRNGGRWTVLRLGYSLTGKANAPATPEATGLEVDKYDAAAAARYIETYLAK